MRGALASFVGVRREVASPLELADEADPSGALRGGYAGDGG